MAIFWYVKRVCPLLPVVL